MAKAIAISLAVHALLLAVRFGAPEAFDIKRSDTALDVVLVNAKSGQQPLKPAALAQADLDGGGDHEQQRASTPCRRSPSRARATWCARCSAASICSRSASSA
ncbi:hypothetical protein OJJOAM_002329 [Cupriavidus sp. H18C1]